MRGSEFTRTVYELRLSTESRDGLVDRRGDVSGDVDDHIRATLIGHE